MHTLFLTFDTEDFISENSVPGLNKILEILKKYDMRALFFITGHMAEKLRDFPDTVSLFDMHLIGYHSSGHSVHPTIYEFTDVDNYEEACKESIQRETAHINPLTGQIEGRGGIHAVRNLFPKHEIVAFRAPGHCWTPPHLEALNTLGINYDFSANLSASAIYHKGIVFYPYHLTGHWNGNFREYRNLFLSFRYSTSVLTIHPSLMMNKVEWDLIYFSSNPQKLSPPPALSPEEIRLQFHEFALLLKRLKALRNMNILEITPELEKPKKALSLSKFDVEKCYQKSIRWANWHNYEPKYIRHHFEKYFS